MLLFRVDRHRIYVAAETPQDEAYVEDTLGLKNEGDSIRLVRHNAAGLSCLGHLCTQATEEYLAMVRPPVGDEE